MEMEKVNENTIRVLLGTEDLTDRGITVLDLLGNQKEIENFFFSILEEVDKDHEFRDNDAVTFQLIPNQNGLELFITKVDPKKAEASMNLERDDSKESDANASPLNIANAGRPYYKKNIMGTVVDNDGEALPGATVSLVGTDNAVVTDIDGNFSIIVEGKNPRIEVSYIGMKTKTLDVNRSAKQKFMVVELDADANLLSEVLV